MTLLVAWVAFPIVLAIVSLGFGLLIEATSGWKLGRLLLPVGFAGLVVVCDLTTLSATTARLAVPFALFLTLVGLAIGARPHTLARLKPNAWVAGSVLAVLAVYAAPVVATGQATFAGYASLDDTAEWFSLIDRVMSAGRSVAGLPSSTYKTLLTEYLGTGYPVGSMIPLGVGAKLVGQDVAWVIQPYFAFQAVLLALALSALLAPIIRSARTTALAVFIAAQPALLYGYSLWGSIKELVTAPLLAVIAVLVARALRETPTIRGLVPIAICTAALLAVLNVAGLVWLAPALLPLGVVAYRLRAEDVVQRVAFLISCVVVLALPTVVTARAFSSVASTVLTTSASPTNAIGELIHPLSTLQLFGIWPVGDFRERPSPIWPTYVLLLILIVLAIVALVHVVRIREFGIPLYLATVVIGCLIVGFQGSAWSTGKALAEGSPAILLAGLAGAQIVRRRPMQFLAGAGAIAIAGGVLWSNALAYSGVRLAPRDQLIELEQIGTRFAGQGPALITEFQPYGVRHFLRGLAVTQLPPKDIDAFPLSVVMRYRTLVLDTSPLESRPPSSYRLVWSGRFYEVWQRVPGPSRVLLHLGLGSGLEPAGVPSCATVESVAARARQEGDSIAAVLRDPAPGFELGRLTHPADWTLDPSGGLYPDSSATLTARQEFPEDATYRVWVGGFTPGELTVTVDGRDLGSVSHRIELPGQYYPLGTVSLSAGVHDVVVRYSRPDLQPGSRSSIAHLPMGPIVFSTSTEDIPVTYLAPSAARTLCGKSLNWLEVVSRR